MSKLVKRRSRKAGLPPGSLVHIGDAKRDTTSITRFEYDEQACRESEIRAGEECRPSPQASTVTWVNVDGVHDAAVIETLGASFALHPLVLEDILNTDQRPKVEDYGDYLYVVLKMIFPSGIGSRVTTEQVSIVLGSNFVLSFQEGEKGDVFDSLRERLRGGKGRIRREGADYLAYSLLDAIVDHYFVVLDRLGEQIEALENEIVARPAPRSLHALHALKREMIFLRRSIWPLREVLASLQRGETRLVRAPTGAYLRDVYDHTIQAMDVVETFRDMLSGMMDIYLSSSSHRLNEVMMVLTVITTFFMPLTFIAGIYGMNFEHMPETKWRWGYPAVLGVMLAIGASMWVYFRRKRWL